MFQGISAIEFSKKFVDNESCYNYLIDLKWGNGYQCSRCGNTEHMKKAEPGTIGGVRNAFMMKV